MATTKRLYKSADPVIAGVCGGIAEYFKVDPTFVRIIAVVLLVVSFGSFLIFYLLAMLVMPKDPIEDSGYIKVTHAASQACGTASGTASGTAGSSAGSVAGGVASSVAGGVASSVAGGTASGVAGREPAGDSRNATGAEASGQNAAKQASAAEQADAAAAATAATAAQQPHSVPEVLRKRWSSAALAGVLLICVGVLILLANLVNLSFWRLWPLVLVVVGIVQLFTPATSGWSVDRAGAAIVLISFGILLLALMLGVVSWFTVLVAFGRLWPVLLIVLGLAILASAKRQQAFGLLSSLLLSATLILGVWLFGDMGNSVTLSLSDERSMSLEIPASPMPPNAEHVAFAERFGGFDLFLLEP